MHHMYVYHWNKICCEAGCDFQTSSESKSGGVLDCESIFLIRFSNAVIAKLQYTHGIVFYDTKHLRQILNDFDNKY